MKKLALALIALAAMTGCTKTQVTCAVQTTLVDAMSQGIATGLQCSNLSAIQASLNQAASGLNMCPSGTSLSLPVSFCQPLVTILVGSVAATAIPSAWGCSAQMAQNGIEGFLMNVCTGGAQPTPTPAPPAPAPSPQMKHKK
jgi:hypothetical protein